MNAGRTGQRNSSGNMGASNPSGQQGGGGLFSMISKLVGSNPNILQLITGLSGNNGSGANSLGSLAGLMGMMNNNTAVNNPMSGLAGMMNNLNSNNMNNPMAAIAGMMNNSGNFTGNRNNGYPPAPNLDINDVLSRLSSMMNNNDGSPKGDEDMKEDPVIDTEENPSGSFSAAGKSSNENINGGINMENLAALWPMLSSFLNNGNKKEPTNNSGAGNSQRPAKNTANENPVEDTYLKKANKESEPIIPCINCLHPCYKRQLPLPTYEQVRALAENWSRY